MAPTAAGLAGFLDASPTPFHATATAAAQLVAGGFTALDETQPFPTTSGGYFVRRSGSLVAWRQAEGDPARPFRIVAAHTDSPNLRIKPLPDYASAGWQMLGVEVYGGPLLGTWTDRDLGLAGRVVVRDSAGTAEHLVTIDEPLLRVSQLAIHFNRSVNAEGLVLDPQRHLAPHWAIGSGPGDLPAYLAGRIGVATTDLLAWDLMAYDLTPARITGRDGATLASARLDNLTSSYAGIRALLEITDSAGPLPVVVLFDHEEVGSTSARGAGSALLTTVLERIVRAGGGERDEYFRALAGTVIASSDAAHATHPNYAEYHEPRHPIRMNGGPVLKVNSQLRYATDATGAAAFRLACDQAGVPMQSYVHRTDLPCGSTVGPMISAATGAVTVDLGAPLLSMHSIRELCGTADQAMLAAALGAFLAPA
ncbi:M18 family aminopeptidase [Nakamurella sp. YIM 132087]|uniref:M18 family aminopeptidase n=1 Tax=Nakamurella alba TaxID=2665158 RepID=A0A7K1FFA4_9ACTN|nr:M18 family aminopeptidase [Nakamurella alba]